MNLGHALLETHQFEPSARASRQALALDPAGDEAANNLALSELCRGRYGETLALASALLERRALHAPTVGLAAAACVLSRDDARLARFCDALAGLGERPAAHLQAYAARLRRAGRGADARRLLDAARRRWKETLAAEGLEATDAQVEALIAAADGQRAEP